MRNNKIKIIILILVSFNVSYCKNNENIILNKEKEIKIENIKILDTNFFEGYLVGASFIENEIYSTLLSEQTDEYLIGIFDLETGKLKKKIRMGKGGSQSPTDFFSLQYIQRVNDEHVIIDNVNKIVLFDKNFNLISSKVFFKFRYFVDFYVRRNKLFFVFGNKRYRGTKKICETEIYELTPEKITAFRKILDTTFHKRLYMKSKNWYFGQFWSSSSGFELNEKIYYSDGSQNFINIYDLNAEKQAKIILPFLKSKKFTDKEATKMGYYKSDGWQDDSRRKIVYKPFPDNIYHFGIFEVGKNKIGIMGDINLEKMEQRLDILEAETGVYLESIWLPIDNQFNWRISDKARGIHLIYIDINKGVYIWNDYEGEDFYNVVKLTRFKILRNYKSD
ncbi:MAG: hypothetical protein HQ555_06910 [Candidatus Aminicenantes bacterium]|nr:hypothetical protein [Candidatus Aminicenantes bacterium]